LTVTLLIVLAAHVVGALGVGVVVLLPFLADQPLAAHRVLLVLRASAIFTAVTGAVLWALTRPSGHFVIVSLVLLVIVAVAIGTRIGPAIAQTAGNTVIRRRLRIESALVAGITAAIAVLMVAKP
jgi:uncharacterized membrane protein YfcA